jgi:hypothetical protein
VINDIMLLKWSPEETIPEENIRAMVEAAYEFGR